ncbi:GNAT family N-acetyltransferase [Corallococcus exercitus]|uniref:GNAT family N-acetyltransferase n=1 Tax=Corallococcus exercitus TaxID=2316736 RepID=A0A7Y4KNG9_9BACT|nr:GNAT family N-acetyltransferase [Corallococcus exercitus]
MSAQAPATLAAADAETPAFADGELHVRLVSTATDWHHALWDERGALRHPLKDTGFLQALEHAYPERRCRYVEVRRGEQVVAQFLLNEDVLDSTMFASPRVKAAVGWVRRIVPGFLRIRVATVGTMDTSGAHWWHEAGAVEPDAFCRVVQRAAKAAFPRAHLLLFRDVLDSDPVSGALAHQFESAGFRRVQGLPIASVRSHGDAGAHYASLNRKVRAFIRKMPGLAAEHGLRLEVAARPLDHLEEAYALFLNVSRRAKEVQREPVPLEFFRQLLRLPGCRMTVARGSSGQMVGFILTRVTAGVASPAYIGLDYTVSDGARLYHQLLWSEIATCLDAGAGEVDLGLTSYFVKQGFGAVLDGSVMLARFQQAMVHRLLGGLIPHLLHIEQPAARRKRPGVPAPTDVNADAGTPAVESRQEPAEA